MTNRLLFILVLGMCGWSNLHADLTIVQKVEGMGQSMESTTMFKPGKTRVDASPATSIIMDLKSGEMVSLMHSQKSYMKIPGQIAAAAFDSMKKMQADQKPGSLGLTPTGKTETISGFPAEEYTCNVAGTKMSLWLTKALPDYDRILKEMSAAFNQGPMAAMAKGLGLDMSALPGFPVRTVNELQPGQTMTSTVVSISTTPVPDSAFEIPPDYKQMTMPTLTPPAAEAAKPVK